MILRVASQRKANWNRSNEARKLGYKVNGMALHPDDWSLSLTSDLAVFANIIHEMLNDLHITIYW